MGIETGAIAITAVGLLTKLFIGIGIFIGVLLLFGLGIILFNWGTVSKIIVFTIGAWVAYKFLVGGRRL